MKTKASKRTSGKERPAKTRELIRSRALDQGVRRAEAVVAAVRSAMKAIEEEIVANDGVYPGNKGGLSLNEVARRADIHSTTLFGSKYEALHDQVTEWLTEVKSNAVTGRMRVRREVTSRVAEWREMYEGLFASNRKTELDLQEVERKLEDAEERIDQLTMENIRLQEALSKATGGKVVPLRGRREK